MTHGIQLGDIVRATCEHFGLPRHDLLSPAFPQRLARPRQLAMFIAREKTALSLQKIGRYFDRDHSTVLYAIRRVTARWDGEWALHRRFVVMAAEQIAGARTAREAEQVARLKASSSILPVAA